MSYFNTEPAWTSLCDSHHLLDTIGSNFITCKGKVYSEREIDQFIEQTNVLQSSFTESVRTFSKLMSLTFFQTHEQFYDYLKLLLQGLEYCWDQEDIKINMDLGEKTNIVTLMDYVRKEFLGILVDPFDGNSYDKTNPYGVMVQRLDTNETKMLELTCEQFWSLESVKLIVTLYRNLYSTHFSDVQEKYNFSDKLFQAMSVQFQKIFENRGLPPILFIIQPPRSELDLVFFGEPNSYSTHLLKQLNALEIPDRIDTEMENSGYAWIQTQLLYCGVKMDLARDKVENLQRLKGVESETKASYFDAFLRKLSTKRIIPRIIERQRYQVDKQTLESIRFAESQPVTQSQVSARIPVVKETFYRGPSNKALLLAQQELLSDEATSSSVVKPEVSTTYFPIAVVCLLGAGVLAFNS